MGWRPDLALELLDAFDFRPLEIVQNASTMQQQMARLFELSFCTVCVGLSELH